MDKTQVAKKRGLSPAPPDCIVKTQKTEIPLHEAPRINIIAAAPVAKTNSMVATPSQALQLVEVPKTYGRVPAGIVDTRIPEQPADMEAIKTRTVTAVSGTGEKQTETSSAPRKVQSDDLVDLYHIENHGKRQLAALDSGYLTDVTILVGNKAIKCHSNIVSFASLKLATILREKEPRLPNVNPRHFSLLLQIIYAGTCQPQNVDTLLQLGRVAHDLEVHAAVVFCALSLAKKVDAENLWRILNFAHLTEDDDLEEACLTLICYEAGTILKNDGFLKCKLTTLKLILEQTTLHKVTELRLFQACVAWANADPTLSRRAALASVLRWIRFRTFSAENFAKHVSVTGLLRAEDERDIFRSLVTGKNCMPEGFSASTSSRDPVGNIMIIDLVCSNTKSVLSSFPKNTSTLLVFSTARNIFIVGVKLRAWRENLPDGCLYDENIVVSLKQKIPSMGRILSKFAFCKKVKKGEMVILKFSHPIEIMCKTIYTLRVAYTQSNRENLMYDLYKQELASQCVKRVIRIDVLNEFLAPPNLQLLVADKVTI